MRGALGSLRRRRTATTGPGRSLALRAFERSGLTRSGLILVALAVLVWILARAVGGRTLYLIVYGGLVVLGASKYLGRRRPALEARRSHMPARLREGQSVDVTVEFTARRRVGTFLLVEKIHPHLGTERRVPVADVRPGVAVTHSYTINARLRGVYEVGPLTAIWTDPFGLTQRTVQLVEPTELIVHPATENVHDRPLTRQWEDPPIRPPVSKPWPSGFEFYGMRNYVPGDDLRRVVWTAVARTGKVLIRESEQGITDKVTLICDTDARWHSPGYPSDTFEAAVRTIASLGTRHLKDGFSVTLETNETRLASGLRQASAQIPFLDHLARLQPGAEPLSSVIDRLVADPRRDAHNILVTPHLDDRSASRLRLLIERGAHVVLVALVWEESDPHTLAVAAALGCQVVQLRPLEPLEAVFAAEMGAGRR